MTNKELKKATWSIIIVVLAGWAIFWIQKGR